MVSVYPFGDEYYTFTETPLIHRIDPKTLETLDKVNVAKYVGIVNHTAHPHIMNDGTVYNIGLCPTKKGMAYGIVEFPPINSKEDSKSEEKKYKMFEQGRLAATIPSRWVLNPSYMHSFGITENYFIIVEQPLALSVIAKFKALVTQDTVSTCLKWYDNENTHILLVSRDTGEVVKTFVAETFFYFHAINSYETQDGNYIVLDLCCYRDPKVIDCVYVEAFENMNKNPDYSKLSNSQPLRFVLPLKEPESNTPSNENLITIDHVYQKSETLDDLLDNDNLKNSHNSEMENLLDRKAQAFRLSDGNIFVQPELLCDMGCETPRINNKLSNGKEYRYFYGISNVADIENMGSVIKVDTKTKTKKIWTDKNIYPSEPIFVPRPNGKNEDDGVVLSVLVWGRERETEVGLVILDGTTFEEIARVHFDTPGPAPKCLHGWFADNVC